MTAIVDLAREQRAVLSLVLGKGRSYAQIAELLHIDEEAVRARAHAALEEIGPRDGTAPPPDRRTEIGDYLLGQQSDPQDTLDYLAGSAVGRAWARSRAAELQALGALPTIPADSGPSAPSAPRETSAAPPAVSRRGGAILLGAIVACAGLVLALTGVFSGGGSKKKNATASTAAAAAPQTKILGQINLSSPDKQASPVGVATLLQQGTTNGIALQVTGLAATSSKFAYGVWLYSSPQHVERIGFAPAVKADGKLGAVAPTPADLANFRELILTRESNPRATHPGTIVLSGVLPKK